MKAIQKGFTLIELMIVVAIIGILAAIALPAYQDYTIRSQVSEGPTLSEGIKVAIADYYANNGTWPADMTAAGFGSNVVSGSYVSSIVQAGGLITIAYGSTKANSKLSTGPATLVVSAAANANGDIAWVCGGSSVPTGFTAAGTATYGGGMLSKWLPSSCR
jgi:type IV pilus assembly protein PilA